MLLQLALKPLNYESLNEAVYAVGGQYIKYWYTDANFLYFVLDSATPEEAIMEIEAVYVNHDASINTTRQIKEALRYKLVGEIRLADFQALLDNINAATTLAQVKPLLRQMLLLQYKTAVGADLVEPVEL